MNKKSLAATAFLALAGAIGVSGYSLQVRAEGVPVKDLTLTQEEDNQEEAIDPETDPETQQYYYGRRYRGYYGGYRRYYYGGYRRYYGGYRRYYGGYRRYYGGYRSYYDRSYYRGYRSYYRFDHDPQDGISTEGLETPQMEQNK